MFRLIIAIAALLVASPTFAQSFLCIADKFAGITINSKTRHIEANSGGVENARFIISKNERGDYEAGWFGSDQKMWNDCKNLIGQDKPNKLFCEANLVGSVLNGYSFAVKSDNIFIAKDIYVDDPSGEMHRIISGKCSRI